MTHPQDWQNDAFQEGSTLGQILAQGQRQIYVMEMIYARLDDLPDRIAEKISQDAKTEEGGISIRWRDIPGVILGTAAVLAVLAGKLSLSDAFGLLGKVSGGP